MAELELAWMFLARIATLQAIHRNEVRQFNPDAKTIIGILRAAAHEKIA